jgi:hypothetical protein
MTSPPHGRIHFTSEVKGYYQAVIDNPPLSPLPAGADLVAAQDAFFAGFEWEGTQQRLGRLFALGFQQPGDVEPRLGDVVRELALGPAAAS